MAAVGAVCIAAMLHHAGHLLDGFRVHLVMTRTDGEGFDADFVQTVPALPVLQVAGDREFAIALHLHINVFVEVLERTVEGVWPGLCTADYLRIELVHHQRGVLGRVELLAGVELLKAREIRRRKQLLFEYARVFQIGSDAGGHVGKDDAAQVLLVFERVLDGKNHAPGMSVQDEVIEAEPATHFLDLLTVAAQCG